MGIKSTLAKVAVNVTAKVAPIAMAVEPHVPTIMACLSIATGIGSVVMAVTGTVKAEEIKKEEAQKLAEIQEVLQDENHPEYGEKEAQKDIRIVRCRTGFKILWKCYGKTILLGVISIALILGSHHLLNKRVATVGAELAAVTTQLGQRDNYIREHMGEDALKEAKYDASETTITIMPPADSGESDIEKVITDYKDNGFDVITLNEETMKWWRPNNPQWNQEFIREACFDVDHALKRDADRAPKGKRGTITMNYIWDRLGYKKGDRARGHVNGITADSENPVTNVIDIDMEYRGRKINQEFFDGEINTCKAVIKHDAMPIVPYIHGGE